MTRRTTRTLLGVGLIAAVAGCRSRQAPVSCGLPAPKPPVQMLGRPAIDLSRGGAGFPLSGNSVPADAAALTTALAGGYAERLESAAAARIDVAAATQPGHYDRVLIDISDAAVKADFVPKQVPKDSQPVGTLYAGLLRYTADPLKYQHYDASMRLEASDAALAVLPAGDGTFGLALTDCSVGSATLRLSMAGLRDSLAKGVKVKQSVAFRVDQIDLDLTSDNPHSLAVDVTVHARLLLVPAKFRIVGRADIDEAFLVHFSGLDATGLDPTGKVVAGVVQAKLDKVNNKAAPLLKMPGDRIRVRSLAIDVGESLNIDIGLTGTAGATAAATALVAP